MRVVFLRQRLEPGREERLDARRRTGELQQPRRRKCFATLDRVGHGQGQAAAVGGGDRGPERQPLRLALALSEMQRVFVGAREERIVGRRGRKCAFGHADDKDAVEGQASDGLYRTNQDALAEAADRSSATLERIAQQREEQVDRGAAIALEHIGLTQIGQGAGDVLGERGIVGSPRGRTAADIVQQVFTPGHKVGPGRTVGGRLERFAQALNLRRGWRRPAQLHSAAAWPRARCPQRRADRPTRAGAPHS